MASTTYPLIATWSATNRYTAAANVDIMLSNPSSHGLHWSITATDTAPVIDEGFGHPVLPGGHIAMQLNSGDRLWFAGTFARATLEV